MNIFQQYGIKEVADVCFYSIEEDENDDEVYVPVLYLDTLKVSTIEQTSSDTAARGGLGNPKLIVWDFGKEITLTLEDALYSPASMSMVWGDKLKVKPFTLNGYITHYEALDLDEYSVSDDFEDAVGTTLFEDEPPHFVGVRGKIETSVLPNTVDLSKDGSYGSINDLKKNYINKYDLTVDFTYTDSLTNESSTIKGININNAFISGGFYYDQSKKTFSSQGFYKTETIDDTEQVFDSLMVVKPQPINKGTYNMNGGNLTDARLTITKFGNFEMSPSYRDTNAINGNYERCFVWEDCEGYIKSKNNKYQYSFKHCKLCYAQDKEWDTGLRGKWYVCVGDDEKAKDGYPDILTHSYMTQFYMTTYDQLTGKPQKIVCNFFPDDLFIQSQEIPLIEPKQPEDADTEDKTDIQKQQEWLDYELKNYLYGNVKYKGLAGFNKNAIMYNKYEEYSDEQFKGLTSVSVADWITYLTDRNESVIPPQECIYQIDHALDNVFYFDRIEKCKASQTFAIDTNLNTLEGNWRYLPAYKQTELTVYIDPKTMQPYEPNTNVFYRRNGDAWYGYDLTVREDADQNGHYDYHLDLKDYQGEDAPYNIKVFKQYEIYYKWTRTRAAENTSLGKQIVVDATHFPGTYRIVGECYSRSRETGKDERFQFEIPLAKVKANQESITLQADGDPTTFTMEIDVLRPENGEMMKLTQYNVIKSEYPLDMVDDKWGRKKQKSGATEIVSEDLVTPEDPFEESNLDDDGSVSIDGRKKTTT